jgi:hypothetical protein
VLVDVIGDESDPAPSRGWTVGGVPKATTGHTLLRKKTILNDAIALVVGGQNVDRIGADGPDVGSGWDVAGIKAATAEHTLRRKTSVVNGESSFQLACATRRTSRRMVFADSSASQIPTSSSAMSCPTSWAKAASPVGMASAFE